MAGAQESRSTILIDAEPAARGNCHLQSGGCRLPSFANRPTGESEFRMMADTLASKILWAGQDRTFARHSDGGPGGVTVVLEVHSPHRKKRQTALDNGRRGLFPALPLLDVQERSPLGVRMAKAAALLKFSEEAATRLVDEKIVVCVSAL